jgi:drug/metabolite transporter (DMT)-like permease
MPTPLKSTHQQAILMLLLANLFWGVSFPLIKALALLHARLVPAAGTWFSTFYSIAPRFLLAAGVLVWLQRRSLRQITRGEWQQGLLIAGFSSIGMLLQNDGLQFTDASTSAFLTQLYAILIPVSAALYFRRNPGTSVWLSCLLVLGGVAILGRFDWQEFSFGRGESETLLSSVFFMGQILCLGWARFAGNRPEKITLVMFGAQAVLFGLLAIGAAPDTFTLIKPWTSVPWLGFTLGLTVFCTLGSLSLMNAWQPKISTTEAGLIYCVEPIFASLMALFLPAWMSRWAGLDYPNETATWTLLAGGALITGANVLIQIRPPKVNLGTISSGGSPAAN